jgi:hypothetical protein
MTITAALQQFIFAVGPNQEPRTLTLVLYLGDKRATVTFEGVNCAHLQARDC